MKNRISKPESVHAILIELTIRTHCRRAGIEII